MRQQIGFIEQHQIGRREHIRIFERLVLALRDGENHDLMRLAEIESGGTHQIPDILDEERRALFQRQRLERMTDHMGVEVTSLARVDLYRRRACLTNALGVIRRLLIALDHRHWNFTEKIIDCAHQQRRLAGSGARNEIQREHTLRRKERPILARIGVILGQDVPFDADDPFLGHAGNMHACDPRAEIDEAFAMPMLMRMVMMMLVRMIVMMGMIVMMIVMCAMGVAMPMRMGMVLAPGAFFLAGVLLRLH